MIDWPWNSLRNCRRGEREEKQKAVIVAIAQNKQRATQLDDVINDLLKQFLEGHHDHR